MSTIRFSESKMDFSFAEEDCYRIEHSGSHLSLGKGVKICECVVRKGARLLFLEAKSSFAYLQNGYKFREELIEIQEKFVNSVLLYAGLLIDRPYRCSNPLPQNLKLESIRRAPLKCCLIIGRYEKEALKSVDEALNQDLSTFRKTFAVEEIKVISSETALKYGIIQRISP